MLSNTLFVLCVAPWLVWGLWSVVFLGCIAFDVFDAHETTVVAVSTVAAGVFLQLVTLSACLLYTLARLHDSRRRWRHALRSERRKEKPPRYLDLNRDEEDRLLGALSDGEGDPRPDDYSEHRYDPRPGDYSDDE